MTRSEHGTATASIQSFVAHLKRNFKKQALCRNLNNSSINGVFEEQIFQYAQQHERERMDKDSGMAGV